MNGNDMAAAIVSALQGVDTNMTPSQIAQLTSSWNAICTAMVTYIDANAVVHVNSVTGVQPGSGNSGSGTGTIS